MKENIINIVIYGFWYKINRVDLWRVKVMSWGICSWLILIRCRWENFYGGEIIWVRFGRDSLILKNYKLYEWRIIEIDYLYFLIFFFWLINCWL